MGVCRVCGESVELLLDFGLQSFLFPLWESAEPPANERKHWLRLDRCVHCGLVQIVDPASPELIYPEANQEMAGWKNLPQTRWQVDLLRRNAHAGAAIVEVGSNDGNFLEALRQSGFSRLVGIEPSRPCNVIAAGMGFDVKEGFATPDLAAALTAEYGRFDILAAKHVFGHIPDLEAFFTCVDALLKADGKIFLEVPDAQWMFDSGDCGIAYEELVSYFTRETLEYTLAHYGYRIIMMGKFDYNGGLLEVLAERCPQKTGTPPIPTVGLDSFPRRVRAYAERLRECLHQLRAAKYPVYLFGGGMRSGSLLNSLDMSEYIDAIIDDNPVKQGRFYPGCGLPIVGSETVMQEQDEKAVFLLAVSNENEPTVVNKITSFFGDNAICASIFAPKNRDAELEKLSCFRK